MKAGRNMYPSELNSYFKTQIQKIEVENNILKLSSCIDRIHYQCSLHTRIYTLQLCRDASMIQKFTLQFFVSFIVCYCVTLLCFLPRSLPVNDNKSGHMTTLSSPLSTAFFSGVADDQRLAGRPPDRPASQSLIVRHTISASENRCG